MAKLRRLQDGEIRAVPARCLLGRSPTCNFVLQERYASGEHARLSWTGSQWEIRDLGSKNGTFVDGKHIEPGRPVTVGVGVELRFGTTEQGWIFDDASAPGALAVDLVEGRSQSAVGEVLLLPTDDSPEVSVYPAAMGAGWCLEDGEGEVHPVRNQEVVQVAGRAWRLELPVMSDATPMVNLAFTLENISLRFEVSQDEERVEPIIILHGKETRLEAREHAYVLLTLARARLEDAELPNEQRGWRTLAELSKMLRMDQNAINVSIHRARQQLAGTGLEGAAGVVEVSRGKRRLGLGRFEIGRLEG